MIYVSIGIALVVSLIMLLEMAFIIWAHKALRLQSMTFDLANGCPHSESRKHISNCNLARYADFVLQLVLLIVTGIFMVLIGLMMLQPVTKAIYIESISVLVFVILASVCIVCKDTMQSTFILNRKRLMSEYQLMSESNHRGQMHSTTCSEESHSENSDNQTDNQSCISSSVGSTRQSDTSKSAEGCFDVQR